MKAIRFVFCLFAALMLTTLNGLAAEEEDFKTFLQKFTSSASFQYSRIKFPLKSPIALLKDDGETEQTFPFTREKWALLDEETLKEGPSMLFAYPTCSSDSGARQNEGIFHPWFSYSFILVFVLMTGITDKFTMRNL